MRRMFLSIALTASIVIASAYGDGYDKSRRHTDAVLGSIVGGVVGAVVGHQMGEGRGKMAATVGGAIVGALMGERIARVRYDGEYSVIHRKPVAVGRHFESRPSSCSVRSKKGFRKHRRMARHRWGRYRR